MQINVNFGSAQQKSRKLNRASCLNFYPVVDNREPPQNNKYPIAYYTCPGYELFSSGVGENRGIWQFGDIVYGVCGNSFYQLNQDGTRTTLGTLSSSTGPVIMRASNAQLMIAVLFTTEAWVYTFSTSAFTQITDVNYLGAEDLEFQDGFFITVLNGQLYLSQALNALSWTPQNTAIPSAQGDKLRSILSYKDELVLFFDKTQQYFYNNGASFPFTQRRGATQFFGIAARRSKVRIKDRIFYLGTGETGTLGIVKVTDYNMATLTDEAFHEQLSKYSTIKDAIASAYEYKGHILVQFTFPTEGKTWVYDDTTKMVHERKSLTIDSQKYSRHTANNIVSFNNQIIIDDYQSGNLYKLNSNIYTENSRQIHGELISTPITKENKFAQFNSLEVDCSNGDALATGQGDNPQIALAISRNNKEFTAERFGSVGREGEYDIRTKYNRLGTGRTWTFKLTYAEPPALQINSVIVHGISDDSEGDS